MKTDDIPLIKLTHISKIFSFGKQKLQALHDVSLEIKRGEALGVVGESGCGKSTLGKIALKLETANSGEIFFQNKSIQSYSNKQMQPLRQQMQMIFQDPSSSLNPKFKIEQIIGEGLSIHKLAYGIARKEIIVKLLEEVGLNSEAMQKYPHEFSGGQKQRIGIARALAVNPCFVVCDEPLSALDVCTQKQVLGVLQRFKIERQLSYLFISHDLHAVKDISDKVAVMYLGHLVELAPTARLYSSPLHPYTEALMDAIPLADPVRERSRKRLIIYGEAPSSFTPPTGCPFHSRCPKATKECKEIKPKLREVFPGHYVSCHAVG